MTDYKPGTVAVATVRGVPNVRVMRTDENGLPFTWAAATPCDGAVFATPSEVADVRPLVVLDLEDAERIGHLADLLGHHIDDVEYAISEFANPTPPKPAEPTGLGAVVEDADGVRHVRVFGGSLGATGMSAWLGHVKDDGGERTRRYADIAAVKVLATGVEP